MSSKTDTAAFLEGHLPCFNGGEGRKVNWLRIQREILAQVSTGVDSPAQWIRASCRLRSHRPPSAISKVASP